MKNMQNISPLFFSSNDQKSKISESESSIDSRTSRSFGLFAHDVITQHVKLYFRRAELININEQKQKEGLKEFYENEILKESSEDQIKRLKRILDYLAIKTLKTD